MAHYSELILLKLCPSLSNLHSYTLSWRVILSMFGRQQQSWYCGSISRTSNCRIKCILLYFLIFVDDVYNRKSGEELLLKMGSLSVNHIPNLYLIYGILGSVFNGVYFITACVKSHRKTKRDFSQKLWKKSDVNVITF